MKPSAQPNGTPHGVHPDLRRDQSTTAPPGKRRGWGWVWLLALAALAYGFWRFEASHNTTTGEGGDGAKKGGGRFGGQMVTPVAAEPAKTGNMPVYLNGLGSVSAYYTATVRSRVDGQLMNVFFKEGEYVKQGDLLAQIDPRPFEVQLQQAEGQTARDQALLTNAKLDLQRYQTLLAEDAIPRQQLDTQVSSVKQYEAAIQQDQAAINNAKLQLTYARITAPISGRIGLRQVDPGNIVHAADANGLLTIAQLQPITVLFTIPEDNLPVVMRKLRAGANLPVDAYNRDMSAKLASGRLLTVDNTIDPQTGTSRLKAVFQNSDNTLFPNQFVNCRLLVNTETNQVIIPAAAIQRGQQGTFVYVVRPNGTAEVRPVTLGITEGNVVSIRSGLNAGEVVVTDGSDRLQPNGKVRVRQPGENNGGPGFGGRRGGGRRGGGQGGPAPDAGAGQAPPRGGARPGPGGPGGPA